MRTGVKLLEVSKTGKGKKIIFQRGTKREEIVVDEILYAMGRAPALDGLKLENAGIDARRRQAAGRRRPWPRSVPHIFARGRRGRAARGGPHRHPAGRNRRAQRGESSLRGDHEVPEKIDYRLKALVTFTDPEIALGRPDRDRGEGAGHRLSDREISVQRSRQGADRRPRIRFREVDRGEDAAAKSSARKSSARTPRT